MPFRTGLATTYAWIARQYEDRKAGKRTVRDTVLTVRAFRCCTPPSPTSSAPSLTAWPWPAAGSINRSSPGLTLHRPPRWSLWGLSPSVGSWSARHGHGHAQGGSGAVERPSAERRSQPARAQLYHAENQGRGEPSGSQDMIGLVYRGVNRLDYDYACHGGIFPRHIESTSDPEIAVGWKGLCTCCPWPSGRRATTRWASEP